LRLGADVPVFVRGRAAWAEGVGEQLDFLVDLPEPWYVLLAPNCQVSTAAIFGDPGLTRNHNPIRIRDFLAGQQDNHCLPVVLRQYPEVAEALSDLFAHAGNAHLTGTGACVFAEFEDAIRAETAARALSGKWKAFAVKGENLSSLHRNLEIL
jgi:4-diphosphocytidyl-2-C-methyl-D-erythritol kinase